MQWKTMAQIGGSDIVWMLTRQKHFFVFFFFLCGHFLIWQGFQKQAEQL
jgi:hypothetical protein